MRRYPEGWRLLFGEPGGFGERVHITQMCIPLKPVFTRHEGDGVQITDEPTGNLDSENEAHIVELLKRMAHEMDYLVIVVTHNPGIALQADVCMKMKDGRMNI